MKARGEVPTQVAASYEKIHMPKNTGAGFFIGMFSIVMGFALIWHIWWMAVLGLVGMIGSFILRSNDDDVDYYVPAHEVHETESAYFQRIGSQA